MKKIFKSAMVALMLTSAAFGNQLTLKQIDTLYHKAIVEHANGVMSSINTLQLNYKQALKSYRKNLADNLSDSNVATLAAVNAELKMVEGLENWKLEDLPAEADVKMKALRKTYDDQLQLRIAKGEQAAAGLNKKLKQSLETLKSELAQAGDVDGALAVHERLKGMSLHDEKASAETYEVSSTALSVGIINDGGDYARGISKQVISLKEGVEYTFSCKVISDSGFNAMDLAPMFVPMESDSWHAGPDWTAYNTINKNRNYVIEKDKFGWSKLTFTWTSDITKKVRLGISTYKNNKTYFKSMSLKQDGKELITKNLLKDSSWNGHQVQIAKGVNKAVPKK